MQIYGMPEFKILRQRRRARLWPGLKLLQRNYVRIRLIRRDEEARFERRRYCRDKQALLKIR